MRSKNPRPGFATEKQVRWISRILEQCGVPATPEFQDKVRALTQEQVTVATNRALMLRQVLAGVRLPHWVVMTPDLVEYEKKITAKYAPRR